MLHISVDFTITKDSYKVRVKPIAVAERKLQSSQEIALKNIIRKTIEDSYKLKTLAELIRAIISGELTGRIFEACKPIYPLRRIDIRRTDIKALT
jgi:small subunit ribosomal protein S3Ae